MPKLILSTWFPFKPYVGACVTKNLIVIRKDWWEQASDHAKIQAVTHELAHVKQRRSDPWFNIKYVWSLLTHGYHNNHYEQNASTGKLEARACGGGSKTWGSWKTIVDLT